MGCAGRRFYFNGRRIDVVAAADDQLFGAAGQPEAAARVPARYAFLSVTRNLPFPRRG